jgi:UDP-GlcNAc:undecaprenyl-phosphate GlcNAc-1-phosphate transferase
LYALLLAAFIFPWLIKLSKKLNYTDKPNSRKLHKNPIPIIGGIGITIVVGIAFFLLPALRLFASSHIAVLASLGALAITGIVDDKISLSATLKLVIQLICAFAIAKSGIRVTSFHGLFGINIIPVGLQYFITILIVSGITNSVNLLDGIDGLVGLFSVINIVVLIAFAWLLNEFNWVALLSVVLGTLVVFIKYNWMPAKMFLGDTGSLFLGFLMSVCGIYLLNKSILFNSNPQLQYVLPIVLIGCFAIPVTDTLRVFGARVQKGKSPFSPDKTHLHHKIIKLINQHKTATLKIAGLHLMLIMLTLFATPYFTMSSVCLALLLIIVSFTLMLNFADNFTTWYRKIKRIENE